MGFTIVATAVSTDGQPIKDVWLNYTFANSNATLDPLITPVTGADGTVQLRFIVKDDATATDSLTITPEEMAIHQIHVKLTSEISSNAERIALG